MANDLSYNLLYQIFSDGVSGHAIPIYIQAFCYSQTIRMAAPPIFY
jgi:hypothetical protein